MDITTAASSIPELSATDGTAPFQTKKDLQNHYKAQARLFRQRQFGTAESDVSMLASSKKLGGAFGVGYGLYFKELRWLQLAFLMLTLLAIPFWIVINTSVFTDTAHKDQPAYGVARYSGLEVYSFSFAAILDDNQSNGTLTWLRTQLAGDWMKAESKRTFLIWISVVDAFGMALFMALTLCMMYWAKGFVEKVDKRTLEVADFTVIVKSLPADATATEVGEYFTRFGKVMDVVLVKNMAPLLHLCAEASLLEERRRLMTDQMQLYNSVLYGKRAEAVERQLEVSLDKMDAHLGDKAYRVKAAFVTFDHEHEARICMHNCPNGWLSSFLQQRGDKFRQCRFWVSKAKAPEDYKFENLACSTWSLALRRILTRGLLAVVLVVCALAITKLSTVGGQQSRSLTWYSSRLLDDVHTAFPYLAGQDGTTADVSSSCGANLMSTCAPRLSEQYNLTLGMTWGQPMAWPSPVDQLFLQRSLFAGLDAAADRMRHNDTASSDSPADLGGCLPCYCLGLSQSAASADPTATWASTATLQCGHYINQYNIHTWGVRIGVSLVIASLNFLLKCVLGLLVGVERHATGSSQEQATAVLSCAYRLVNSAVVLLLVNASPLRTATQNVAWLRYFILSGQYSDFTPEWYQNVGISVVLLLLLNMALPLLTAATDVGLKALSRCCLLRCSETAGQHQYNDAFAPPSFKLEERVSDIMFNVLLALMFGSGLPLCYLVVLATFIIQELVDRATLTHVYCAAVRYGKGLPMLILGALPWALLLHCAFGVWMHSYFLVNEATDARGVITSLLHGSSTWHRITRPNALPLMICTIAVFALMIVGRIVVWTLLAPLFTRWCQCNCLVWYFAEDPTTSVSYGTALTTSPRMLKGVPTYRLPYHPRYHLAFSGKLYQAIWMHAVGNECYTYVALAQDVDGEARFVITQECVQVVDEADLEAAAAWMPDTLAHVVKRMSGTAVSLGSQSRTSSGRTASNASLRVASKVPSGLRASGNGSLATRTFHCVAEEDEGGTVLPVSFSADGTAVAHRVPPAEIEAVRWPSRERSAPFSAAAAGFEAAPRPPIAINQMGKTVAVVASARQLVARQAMSAASGGGATSTTPPGVTNSTALRSSGIGRFSSAQQQQQARGEGGPPSVSASLSSVVLSTTPRDTSSLTPRGSSTGNTPVRGERSPLQLATLGADTDSPLRVVSGDNGSHGGGYYSAVAVAPPGPAAVAARGGQGGGARPIEMRLHAPMTLQQQHMTPPCEESVSPWASPHGQTNLTSPSLRRRSGTPLTASAGVSGGGTLASSEPLNPLPRIFVRSVDAAQAAQCHNRGDSIL